MINQPKISPAFQLSHIRNAGLPPYIRLPGLVFPKIGLVATALGTLAAIINVPDAFEYPGQLQIPALLLIIGIMIAPALAIVRDFRSIIRVENVLAMMPVYWLLLDPLQGQEPIDIAQKNDVIRAFLAAGLFSVGVWLGCLGRPWPSPGFLLQSSRRQFSSSITFNMILSCFCLGIFYFLFKAHFNFEIILASFQKMRWEAAWTRDNAEGGWEAFIEHLAYFGMVLPSLTVILARKVGWTNWRTIAAWMLAFSYTLFQAQMGNRRYLGVMFGAAIVTWLFSARKVGARQMLSLALAGICLLFLLEVVFKYRNEGIELFTDTDKRQTITEVEKIRIDDNFLRLAQTMYFVPSRYPYVFGDYIIFALIRPIPRVFWPGKPISPTFRIQDQVQNGASLSSSVVGELYASGGLLMIIFGGWLYARLGVWFNVMIRPPVADAGSILYGAWLMALFAGGRSMQDLVMMSYVVLAMIVLLKMFPMRLLPVLTNPAGPQKVLP